LAQQLLNDGLIGKVAAFGKESQRLAKVGHSGLSLPHLQVGYPRLK
jgi:hypothetical protein